MCDHAPENFISAAAADKLIAAHDGDLVLVYLYVLRTGCSDPERAAGALYLTRRQVDSALEKLGRMELLSEAPAAAAQPPQIHPDPEPQYTAADIERRRKEDPLLDAFYREVETVLGQKLSSPTIKNVFGIYDSLGLPLEVIMEMLNYTLEVFQTRSGGRERPYPKALIDEANRWARLEIRTLEQAEEYIRQQRERRDILGRVKEALDIRDRNLRKNELQYVEDWLNMGFREDAISEACDRTYQNTGKLKWPYMNSILCSWHNRGLHTLEEIEANDGIRRKPADSESSDVNWSDIFNQI